MSQQLDPADEDLLQSALTSSFTNLPPRPTPPLSPPPPPAAQPPVLEPTPAEAASASPGDDPEKEEYERQLAAWRAESARAREKAEKTRAEWEVKRKAEEEEERRRAAEHKSISQSLASESAISGWETVNPAAPISERVPLGQNASSPVPGTSVAGGVGTSDEASAANRVAAATSAAHQHELRYGEPLPSPGPSPADARDLVSGESSRSRATSGLSFPSSPPANPLEQITPPGLDSEEEGDHKISKQWEEIPSLASSFPSLPENISSSSSQEKVEVPSASRDRAGTTPSTREDLQHVHHQHHHDGAGHPQHSGPGRPTAPSMTLSVFNTSLPVKTRAIALLSAITINMFLPFVNGVMLGFGEIFARNVIAPFLGWKGPASVANVGLGTSDKKRRK